MLLSPDTIILPLFEYCLRPSVFWLLFIHVYNDSAGILEYKFWWNIIEMTIFHHTMENFFHISWNYLCIFWHVVCTINLLCCNNACFLISEEASLSSNYVFDCCKPNDISNSFLIYIYNSYDIPHVFQRSKFQWWED